MTKRDRRTELLFPLGSPVKREPMVGRPPYPIWTEKKAKLIERYLFLFLRITHHGTYIDGFTGPQDPEKPETWAAKLAIELRPRLLRHFYLFEMDPKKIALIEAMRDAQPPRDKKKNEPPREVIVESGDANTGIRRLLESGVLKREKEATFCLLDQHTFECEWATVEALARYKQDETKIEIFYFMPTGWFGRAVHATTKNTQRLRAWWGRDDWDQLKSMTPDGCRERMEERFRSELKYASVKGWPIMSKKEGGHVMYHMIHATDHLAAPELMSRAYRKVVRDGRRQAQLGLYEPHDK